MSNESTDALPKARIPRYAALTLEKFQMSHEEIAKTFGDIPAHLASRKKAQLALSTSTARAQAIYYGKLIRRAEDMILKLMPVPVPFELPTPSDEELDELEEEREALALLAAKKKAPRKPRKQRA